MACVATRTFVKITFTQPSAKPAGFQTENKQKTRYMNDWKYNQKKYATFTGSISNS
jgi:hypothetical protein